MAAVSMPHLPGARGSRDWSALTHASIGKSRSVCPARSSGNTRAGRPCFLSICWAKSCIMAAPVCGARVASLTDVMGAKTLPRRCRPILRADLRSCGLLSRNTCCCSWKPAHTCHRRLRAISTPQSCASTRTLVRKAKGPAARTRISMVAPDHAWTGSTASGSYRCAHWSCPSRMCCYCSWVTAWCRVWAGPGSAPIGATRYVLFISAPARTIRWFVLTGMRPKTCTRATCMSLGAKMKFIIHFSLPCAPTPLRVHVHPVYLHVLSLS